MGFTSDACWFLLLKSLLKKIIKKERGGAKKWSGRGRETSFFFTWPKRSSWYLDFFGARKFVSLHSVRRWFLELLDFSNQIFFPLEVRKLNSTLRSVSIVWHNMALYAQNLHMCIYLDRCHMQYMKSHTGRPIVVVVFMMGVSLITIPKRSYTRGKADIRRSVWIIKAHPACGSAFQGWTTESPIDSHRFRLPKKHL